MNNLTLLLALAVVAAFGLFWFYIQNEMAQERCLMNGGTWSTDERECIGG